MLREDLAWLAGLLEGEGCFQNRSDRHCSPLIQLVMTDKDVVIRGARIMGCYKVIEQSNRTKGGLRIYRTNLYGKACIQLMRRLRPFMGIRRTKQITEILDSYWNQPRTAYPERKPYSRGAKIVWMKET